MNKEMKKKYIFSGKNMLRKWKKSDANLMEFIF
jgi:hypothetical protein